MTRYPLAPLVILACIGLGYLSAGASNSRSHEDSGSPAALTGRSRSCARGHDFESDHGGISRDPSRTARLERLGRSLTARIDELTVSCRFRLLNTQRRDAYSLSCGCIYVTRGLFDDLDTDGLLAAALAHEMAHVVARDGKRPCGDSACQLSREIRADKQAVIYLRRAKYNPQSLLKLIRLLEEDQPEDWAEHRLLALRRTQLSP